MDTGINYNNFMSAMQMQIHINGAVRTIQSCNLAELVQREAGAQSHVAVALNNQVVHAQDWPQTLIKDGDQIEIVQPFAGG